MKHLPDRTRAGWVLLAGLALVSLGLVTDSQVGGGQEDQRYLSTPSYATSDSNGSMIAVTGIDVTGGSILYLVDTESRQLAVYTATGGTSSTMGVKFVGARNIDLDLQVDGYNDKSDYSYKELAKQFERAGTPGDEKD